MTNCDEGNGNNSPAYNMGNVTTCLPNDQRDLTRDSAYDIGAYEANVAPTAISLQNSSVVSTRNWLLAFLFMLLMAQTRIVKIENTN